MFTYFLVFGCAGLYFGCAGAISGCTGAGFGRTGHMIERSAVPLSSEMREAGIHPKQRRGEKLAYIPSSAEERERERECWHTTRSSPRREILFCHLPGGAKTSCFCVFCCIWAPLGSQNLMCSSYLRTGSIWLGLGRYLRRIHPMGSGMPLGCLLDPQNHPKSNQQFSGFRGSGC